MWDGRVAGGRLESQRAKSTDKKVGISVSSNLKFSYSAVSCRG